MTKPINPKIAQKIRSELSRNNLPLFIYGAGLHASEIESFFAQERIPIEAFIVGDDYVNSTHKVQGKVKALSDVASDYPDFHTVIGFCHNPAAVEAELISSGIGGSGQRFAIDCRFWREFQNLDEKYVESNSKEIEFVRNLFHDDLSRITFDEIISTKITNDPLRLAGLVRNPQYFPHDLTEFAPRRDDVIVDAGAFIGDTLADFLPFFPDRRCQAYHAFEADPNNASKLMEFVRGENLDFVQLHQVALGASQGKARFTAGGTSSSRLDDKAGIEVNVASLDSFMLTPTLIKMDIEGAELGALRGARQTISQCRPRLAVTIYHSLEDFLGIPPLVKELCFEYRLYLRIHRPYTEEFVLYAVT